MEGGGRETGRERDRRREGERDGVRQAGRERVNAKTLALCLAGQVDLFGDVPGVHFPTPTP